MQKTIDFDNFVKAVVNSGLDVVPNKATSHTSAVDVREWVRTTSALDSQSKSEAEDK